MSRPDASWFSAIRVSVNRARTSFQQTNAYSKTAFSDSAYLAVSWLSAIRVIAIQVDPSHMDNSSGSDLHLLNVWLHTAWG